MSAKSSYAGFKNRKGKKCPGTRPARKTLLTRTENISCQRSLRAQDPFYYNLNHDNKQPTIREVEKEMDERRNQLSK